MSQVRMSKGVWLDILNAVRRKSETQAPLKAVELPPMIEEMGQFATTVYGEDNRELQVSIPFQPDAICVYSPDAYANAKSNTYRGFMAELRTAGGYMGHVSYRKADGTAGSSALGVGLGLSAFQYRDGVFRFVLPEGSIPTVLWRSNVRYTVWAAHFPSQQLKALIEEQIAHLPTEESGTLTFNADRINECFTDAEWEALIATRPGWSFVLDD